MFADCVRGLRVDQDDPQLRGDLSRALACPAVDPLGSGAGRREPAARDPRVRGLPTSPDALDAALREGRLDAVMQDGVLLGLLDAAIIADWALEQALAGLRGALLRVITTGGTLTPGAFEFAGRLAIQCFLTEYVYAETDAERAAVAALAKAVEADLAADRTPRADRLAVLACYRPLRDLRGAEGLPALRLEGLQQLVAAQIEAPREEQRLQSQLPALGTITDPVSQAVRAQYEEHPYPRWARIGTPAPRPLLQFVHAVAPEAAAPPGVNCDAPAVLVAGAGTGRHPLQTASRILGATGPRHRPQRGEPGLRRAADAGTGVRQRRVHAGRHPRARRRGRTQAAVRPDRELRRAASPPRSVRGLAVLAGLLKPGGFMTVGFYSERARQPVVACRSRVRAGGYGSSAEDIRRFRQDLVREGPAELAAAMMASPDFYSVSDCRDLVFHVEEHRYDLPSLVVAGQALGLRWLGLDVDDPALQAASAALSPHRQRADDITWWDRLEQRHPEAFAGTYKLWWQKP